MPLKGPLAITDRKRKYQFDPVAAHTLHPTPRAQVIRQLASRKKGINPRIKRMSIKGVGKLEGMGKLRGWTQQQLRIRQALFLDRICSENADHMLEAIRKVNALPDIAKRYGIPFNTQTETLLWEKMFGEFVIEFGKNPKISNAKEIIRARMWIEKYLTVPNIIHKERARHWTKIQSVVNNLIRKNIDPQKNLLEETQRVLNKKMVQGKEINEKRITHLRALDLMVAASIYADTMKLKKTDLETIKEKERFWNHAYSEAMESMYPLLENKPEIITELRQFHNVKTHTKKKLLN
ncbi:MAG: hypothetical protein WC821_04630 [archaeon]|jgi:hypothetical protein